MKKRCLCSLLSILMIFSAFAGTAGATDIEYSVDSEAVINVQSDATVMSDSEVLSDAEVILDENNDADFELQASENIFKATFDSLTPNAAFNNKNGASNYYSTGFTYANEAGTNGNGSVSRKATTTNVTVVEREGNGNAVKFVSSGNAEDAVFIGSDQIAQSVSSSDIIHYNFDLRMDDNNSAVKFSFKDETYGYLWNFLRFETNGLITFHENVVATYETGKWYKIEMYYIASTGVWHLFIDGNYAEKATKAVGITSLNVMRIGWTAPQGVTTTVYVDNLVSDYANVSDLKNVDSISNYDTVTFSNPTLTISNSNKTDVVDSKNIKYNNYASNIMVKYENKGGKFGKSANDRAVHIYNTAGYHTPAAFGYFDYTGFDTADKSSGNKLYYSAEFAIDNDTSNSVWFQLITQSNRPDIFKIDPATGAISSNGTIFQGVTISKNQWYKLDLIITVGETGVSYNTIDVYLNGKKLNTNPLKFNATATDKSALTSATIRNASYLSTDTASETDADYDASKTKYKANSIWFDNVTAGVYPVGKSVVSPSLTFDNPNVDFCDDRIENVGRTTTVEQLIDGTYCNFPIEVIDMTGEPVADYSALAKGKILVINSLIGGDIYIPVYDIPFPADYTEPQISLVAPSDGSEYYYDIDIDCTLKADVKAYDSVEDVVFYLDGEVLANVSQAPYEYTWLIPNLPGAHKLKASVIDYYGTYAESREVNVTIKSNAAPAVGFVGLAEQTDIYTNDTLEFTVESSDTDGTVTKTEVYLNNKLYDTFTSASKQYTLTFKENGRQIIKAVCYDNFGYQGTALATVNVLKTTAVNIGSFDFEAYSAGKTFANSETISNASYTGSAIEFAGDRGKKDIVSSKGNNYLRVGVHPETIGGSSSPYAAFRYAVANAIVEFKADMLFSSTEANHTMVCRSTSASGGDVFLEPISFNNEGKIRVYNGGVANDVASYEAGVWYRTETKLDYQNKKLDFKVIKLGENEEVIVDVTNYTLRDQTAYKLTHIRFVPGYTSDNPGYIGYDNVEMSYVANYPSVAGFADNLGSDGFVANNAESLWCVMSEAIGDITLDDIKLENEYGEVTLSSATINGENIVVTPKDGFVSSTNYKITIKSSAKLTDGSEFGYDTIAYFDTEASDFDVIDGSFTSSTSGITFTADIVNTTSQSKTVTLVTSTYRDGILLDVYSKAVTLSVSDDVSSDVIPVSADYDSIKAFVITSWSSGVPVSPKTFVFNK